MFKVEDDDTDDNDEDDYETDGPSALPKSLDRFMFLATVPGFSAVRSKIEGTWFIQELCKVLRENSNR